MRLTVLGCSGSVPAPGRAASGYLVEADGFTLGIEFGNGVLAQLQTVREPFDLDALVLSHLHADHCADMTALTVLRRYHPAPPFDTREHRLPVYAPEQAPSRLAAAYAASADERRTADLNDVYEFHTLERGTRRVGPFELDAVPVDHPVEAYGLRLEYRGTTLAYTGDSGPCGELEELCSGVDTLLAEASWTDTADRPTGVHLSGRQAGELTARAGGGRLLLTHIAPWTNADVVLDEARSVFSGPVDVVEQGAVYHLSRVGESGP